MDNVSIQGTMTNTFSHPGQLLWMSYLHAAAIHLELLSDQPAAVLRSQPTARSSARHQVWQYDFPVHTNEAFFQTNGHIYWLSVSAQSQNYFGWKTAATNWNDDAVYGHVDNAWLPAARLAGAVCSSSTARSLDLAFGLITLPFTPPPVITNITVTNQVTPLATNQVVGLAWTYENGIHYQVLYATNLHAGSTNIDWMPCGPEVVGPTHWYWGTNAAGLRRFYVPRSFREVSLIGCRLKREARTES